MPELTVGYVAGMVAFGIFIGKLSLATSTKIRIMWVARGVWPTQFNWLVLIHNSKTQDNVARDSTFTVLLFHFADSIQPKRGVRMPSCSSFPAFYTIKRPPQPGE